MKTSMKAQYLSRAYEVQPAFNHVMIGELGDEARIALLDCAQWAEGESTLQATGSSTQQVLQTPRLEQDETDSDILDALTKGNVDALVGLIDRLKTSYNPGERLSKAYLTAVSSAPDDALKVVLDTNMVDFHKKDDINDRNCLHKTAMAGRPYFLKLALANGVDPSIHDAYGRISLHYACMNGHVELINDLVQARPETIETADLDGFTPLLHAITHNHLACVERLLSYSASVDRTRDGGHIPLNLACQYGSVQIVQLLLSKNPVIMPDVEGLYPQHLVARFGLDPQLLLMLRDYGASLDQPDKYLEWTPLFHAANDGRVECLQKLLELGVNAAAKDEKDLTAQYYAIWEGHLECMSMLAEAVRTIPVQKPSTGLLPMQAKEPVMDFEGDIDVIPDLALPPPYMPSRQYGHNFLDAKTTVLISFNDSQGVTFYDASKYPAARLTISPKSADIVPRNILLPIQDENRHVHFEMDDLAAFSVDFDVFPTFGKRVIAKGSVPSKVFHDTQSSSGHYNLSLFDPRLRSVGEIYFKFQVIKPFSGIPLEITPYATYWKATSQPESKTNSHDMQVTVSSLSGEYVRLYIQVSRDGVPILSPQWTVQESQGGSDIPIAGLTYENFVKAGAKMFGPDHTSKMLSIAGTAELPAIHKALASSHASLEAVLAALPAHVHVELHVLYPDRKDEAVLHLGPSLNINIFVDNILKVIFEHARSIRHAAGSASRGIVFTSYNKDLCTALNLKQPNCE
jgi:CDK inhibitor PHO81